MDASLFTLKKAALFPRTLYMRHVKERDLDGPIRTMFEANYYRKPLYAFTAATMQNPDILIDADLDETSVVLDVGAYVGDWTEKISNRYGCQVYAFEPGLVNMSFARKRLKEHENVQLCAYGLGAEDATVHLTAAGPGSSIYDTKSPLGDAAEVSVRDVVGVLDELGLHEVDLIKINIEGAEFDLLDRLIDAGRLPSIRQAMIQFHEFHPDAYRRRHRVRRALRETHEVVWDYPWVWELWQRRTG
jgi:FkbM family methyltransferase